MVGPQSQMASELNGSAGAAAWDHEKLNQLRLYLKDESPTDGFVEVLAGDTFPHHGSLVPGGGNSIGFEEMKIIEMLEYLKSVAAGRNHRPDFEDALAVANVQSAMIRSWENGTWEDVTPIDWRGGDFGNDPADDGPGHRSLAARTANRDRRH